MQMPESEPRKAMPRLILLVMAALLLLPVSVLGAEDYPNRNIRVVVPFAPGGAVDLVARVIAKNLSEKFKQQVYVENKPGASGNLGADVVAQASPDGYTLLVSASTFVVNPVVSAERTPFNPLTDFSYLGLIAKGPLLFVVNPGVATSVQEFVAKARAHPESINFATGGYGSAGHMAAESFKLRAGLNVPVVLYKGTAPVFTDLIGGHISALMDPLLTSLPLAKGKQVTALAIASDKRSSLAPDIPTFAEAGFPGFEFYTWYGLWSPAKLPDDVVNRIEQALAEIGKSPEVQHWFETQGLAYSGINGKAFHDFAVSEQNLYKEIVDKAKLIKP